MLIYRRLAALALLVSPLPVGAAMAQEVVAQEAMTPAPVPNRADPLGYHSGVSGYFDAWFTRSAAARASQPNWMTPLITVTPRLEQEVRYDQYWQHAGNGTSTKQYDSGKGLELIPTTTNEVLLNPPSYLNRTVKRPAEGWGDWPFLTVKQRLISANAQNGDYILSAFLGVQAPSGNKAFTNNTWIVTPTLAGGKGWGPFDIQSTVAIQIATSHEDELGNALVWNTALQAHVATYFWPEFEVGLTHWFGGERDGKTQVMLEPGLILGRFALFGDSKAIVGAGYQFAVTPKLVRTPVLTPVYDHAWILTTRLTF